MAGTIMVTNLADSGPGSLRAAITSANGNSQPDIICFKKKLSGTIPFTSGPMDITGELMIDGPGASRITFSGNNASRIFNLVKNSVQTPNVTINNVTIADACNTIKDDLGAITATRGGAILNDGGTLRLTHVTMRNNRTIDISQSTVVGGGAVVNSGLATLVATDCLFVNNIASGGSRYSFGGAIGNVTESLATIENCAFIGNELTSRGTSYGGAIGNLGQSSLTVINCVFDDNTARGSDANEKAFGGAIATRPGTVDQSGSVTEIDCCLFTRNLALNTAEAADAGGGALYNERSMLSVEWSSFLRNEAVGGNAAGGALHNALGLMSLAHTTINANLADGGSNGEGIGGGLYNLGTVTADKETIRRIVGNKASTSNDNVYGPVTLRELDNQFSTGDQK